MKIDMKEDASQDYCTLFFEGSWSLCCQAHDKAYEMQIPKGQADMDLYNCVRDSSSTFGIGLVAALMFVAVSLLGKRFYKK